MPSEPSLRNVSDKAKALAEFISKQPLLQSPILEKQVFNDLVGSGDPPTIAEVLSFLVPGQEPLAAPLEVVPGAGKLAPAALFGLSKRAKRLPFFHGTNPKNVPGILEEGFTRGASSEAKIPGTSTSQDPALSLSRFSNQDLEGLLSVDAPRDLMEGTRNLSPEDFLRLDEVLETLPDNSPLRKPQSFFQELETFFPREPSPGPVGPPSFGTGPQARVRARRPNSDELRFTRVQSELSRGVDTLAGSLPMAKLKTASEAEIARLFATRIKKSGSTRRTAISHIDDLLGDQFTLQENTRIGAEKLKKFRDEMFGLREQFAAIQSIGSDAADVSEIVRDVARIHNVKFSEAAKQTKAKLFHNELMTPQAEARSIVLTAKPESMFTQSAPLETSFTLTHPGFLKVEHMFRGGAEPDAGEVLKALAEPTTSLFREANKQLDELVKRLERGKLLE